MTLTELVNQNRGLLTTIATNHSFAERLNAMANLPMELQRYLLDEAATIDKAAAKVLEQH